MIANHSGDNVVKKAERFKHPKIACLGLTVKADIDDLRESPAVEILKVIGDKNICCLMVVEPNIKEHPDFETWDMMTAIAAADRVLALVDHQQFKTLN